MEGKMQEHIDLRLIDSQEKGDYADDGSLFPDTTLKHINISIMILSIICIVQGRL